MARDDDFKGEKTAVVQPRDVAKAFQYEVTVATSLTANNGHIGFGRSVSSVTATTHKESDGIDVTDLLNTPVTEDSNILTAVFDYPASAPGTYHITFLCTLDNGSVVELDFNRIECVDK